MSENISSLAVRQREVQTSSECSYPHVAVAVFENVEDVVRTEAVLLFVIVNIFAVSDDEAFASGAKPEYRVIVTADGINIGSEPHLSGDSGKILVKYIHCIIACADPDFAINRSVYHSRYVAVLIPVFLVEVYI